MPSDRPSRMPSVNTQLVTAIIVALGIGGGGGSLLAAGHDPEALNRTLDARSKAAEVQFATKLEVAALSSELALVTQELQQVSQALAGMTAQLTSIEESVRDNHNRRRR